MYSILNSLSEKEREYALKLYEEMSNGDDSSYKKLLLEDYEEIPVTIEEFLHEPRIESAVKYIEKVLYWRNEKTTEINVKFKE